MAILRNEPETVGGVVGEQAVNQREAHRHPPGDAQRRQGNVEEHDADDKRGRVGQMIQKGRIAGREKQGDDVGGLQRPVQIIFEKLVVRIDETEERLIGGGVQRPEHVPVVVVPSQPIDVEDRRQRHNGGQEEDIETCGGQS